MDKCNDVFHSIERGSNSTCTKDEYAIQNTSHDLQLTDLSSNLPAATNGGDTHLHSHITGIIPGVINTTDERFTPNGTDTTAILTSNSDDIMPRLIKAYKMRVNYAILLLSLITIGTITASSVLFVLPKQNETEGLNKTKPLIYGIITATASLILLMIVCFLCNGPGVDLINNVMETGWILGVFLVTRDKSESEPDKGRNTMFQVDLFMPSHIKVQEVTDIRQIILSNSHEYLVASKFYVNSQVNPQ